MEKHSEERLAAIVESSFDAIISKDLSGRIVSWNKAAEGMFGYTEMEAVGQPIYLIVPDDKRDEEAEILRRLTLGERIETFETTRRHRDGRLVPISITISPIKSRAWELVGASSIARDVTQTKEKRAAASPADAGDQSPGQEPVCGGAGRHSPDVYALRVDRGLRKTDPRTHHGAVPFP